MTSLLTIYSRDPGEKEKWLRRALERLGDLHPILETSNIAIFAVEPIQGLRPVSYTHLTLPTKA